jgi:hypothetical protein
MDEKYIENLGGSTHIEEGLWNRMKSRASGYKRAAQNIMGKSTASVEDVRFESLFKGFVKNAVKVLEYFDSIIKPYFTRKESLSNIQLQQIRNLRGLKHSLQRVEKIGLFEAGPLIPPFSMLGAKASGQIEQVLDSTIQQLTKVYNKFETDARKMGIVPDQFLSRRMSAISPTATDALKQYGKVIGKNIVSTPPEDTASSSAEPPPLPATPSEPPMPTDDAPVASVKSEPERSIPSPTSDVSSESPSEVEKIQYSLILKAINKIAQVLDDDDNREQIRNNTKKFATKANWVFPELPVISHKYSTSSGNPPVIYLWHLRIRNVIPISYIEFQSEIIPEGSTTGRKSEWEKFIQFSFDDILNDEATTDDELPNPNFDIIEQIRKTNPKLKSIIDKNISTEGIPQNIDKLNYSIADSLLLIRSDQAPDVERGGSKIRRGEKIASADQTGRTSTTGQTP